MVLTCTVCFSRLFHYITLNVTFYYAGIVINAPNNTEIIVVKLKITNSFIIHIHVSNACITEFPILILLGDEWIPLFRLCLKVNTLCFVCERSLKPYIKVGNPYGHFWVRRWLFVRASTNINWLFVLSCTNRKLAICTVINTTASGYYWYTTEKFNCSSYIDTDL